MVEYLQQLLVIIGGLLSSVYDALERGYRLVRLTDGDPVHRVWEILGTDGVLDSTVSEGEGAAGVGGVV